MKLENLCVFFMKMVIVFILMSIPVYIHPKQTNTKSALNVLLDYSGSMIKNNRIDHTKNSSKTLIDILQLWKEIYPESIENIDFQLINFGGKNEIEEVYSLSSINDMKYNEIMNIIDNSNAFFKNTDYQNALKYSSINLSKYSNVKTIFLTDGIDEGKGPDQSFNYNLFGDTKFIIFDNKNLNIDKWLNQIKKSQRYDLDDEFGVTSILISTLFEYVDDINQYLIRKGCISISNGILLFSKHSSNESQQLIISKKNKNVKISHIKDTQGNIYKENIDYKIYDRSAFIQISFDKNVRKGSYRIYFDQQSQLFDTFYISFEKADIQARLSTHPPYQNGIYCNSSVNINYFFWDSKQKENIEYKDFLPYVSAISQFAGLERKIVNTDNYFKTQISIPDNYQGSYDIKTAWSYNHTKLNEGQPSPKIIDKVNIKKDGVIFDLYYDKENTWQGRNLDLTIKISSSIGNLPKIDKLTLLTGVDNEEIQLFKKHPTENTFYGKIQNLRSANYQISLKNQNSENYAFSQASETNFIAKKRQLVLTSNLIAYDNFEKISFLTKMRYAWNELTKLGKVNSFKQSNVMNKKNLLYYGLPYKGEIHFFSKLQISLNKIFPGEEVYLSFQASGDSIFSTRSAVEALDSKFAGLFKKEFVSDNVVQTKIRYRNNQKISYDNNMANLSIDIYKKASILNIQNALSVAPTVQLTIIDKQNFGLDVESIVFDIKTSPESLLIYYLYNIGLYVLMLTFLLLTCFLLLLFMIILIRKKVKKSEIWKRCKDKSPEDFYSNFPIKLKSDIEKRFLRISKEKGLSLDIADYETEIKNKRMYKMLNLYDSDKFNQMVKSRFSYTDMKSLERLIKSEVTERNYEFLLEDENKTITITNFEPDSPHDEDKIRIRSLLFTNYGQFIYEEYQLQYQSQSLSALLIRSEQEIDIDYRSVNLQLNDKIVIGKKFVFHIFLYNKKNLKINFKKNL